MQICVIQMGGTIDKVYPQVPNAYGFEIQHAQSVEILNRWRVPEQFFFHSIAQKDSQDLDMIDLEHLVEYIRESSFDGYLITHGTDTLDRTGTYMKAQLTNFKKPIVLTGSRLPSCVTNSDAALNLGMSVGVIQSVSDGIFIVLDGKFREIKS